MRFRVPLFGDGASVGTACRANAPHYTMVDVDYNARMCTVDIPADRLPANLPGDAAGGIVQADGLPQLALDAIARLWDQMYGDNRFRMLGK